MRFFSRLSAAAKRWEEGGRTRLRERWGMEVRVLLLWGRCGLRLLPVGGLKSGGDGRGEEVREESGGSGVGKKAGRGVQLTAAALMMGEMGGRERGQQRITHHLKRERKIDSNSNTTILEQ